MERNQTHPQTFAARVFPPAWQESAGDLELWSIEELRALAGQLQLRDSQRLNRAELIELLGG
jgi:hypothetical protein